MTAAIQPLPTSTRRVLVIDDEPAVLKVIGLVLQRRGFAVDDVGTGSSAMTVFSKLQPDYVKLAGAFVAGIAHGARHARLLPRTRGASDC